MRSYQDMVNDIMEGKLIGKTIHLVIDEESSKQSDDISDIIISAEGLANEIRLNCIDYIIKILPHQGK